VNWSALHLETAQRDYLLRLRLGTRFDHAGMAAEIHESVLTVTLPKLATSAGPAARLRRVA
jgi:HSP20 family molecular chaperone IbpA